MSLTPSLTRSQAHRSTGDVSASDRTGEVGAASAAGMDPIVAIMVYLYESAPVKAGD